MPYFVYIIESIKHKRRYIGSTSDPEKRLNYHNKGANRSTRPYRPYKSVYLEKLNSKIEALKREKQLKSYKGGEALKKLILSWSGGAVNRTRL